MLQPFRQASNGFQVGNFAGRTYALSRKPNTTLIELPKVYGKNMVPP